MSSYAFVRPTPSMAAASTTVSSSRSCSSTSAMRPTLHPRTLATPKARRGSQIAINNASKTHTDLPLSQCDNGEGSAPEACGMHGRPQSFGGEDSRRLQALVPSEFHSAAQAVVLYRPWASTRAPGPNPVCVKDVFVGALKHAGRRGRSVLVGPGVAFSEEPVFRVQAGRAGVSESPWLALPGPLDVSRGRRATVGRRRR